MVQSAFVPEKSDFQSLKAGDNVTRWLAGMLPIRMKVTSIKDEVVHCAVTDGTCEGCDWTFDQNTGAEIDLQIGWEPPFSSGTGSFITLD